MRGAPARRVLWAAALRNKPLKERLLAAAGAGFTHMSVFPIDMVTWRTQGMTYAEIGQMIRDAGVSVNTIDPYVRWTPGIRVEEFSPENRAFVDHTEDAVFEMAHATGATQVNLYSQSDAALDLSASADAVARITERARSEGLRLTFEFIPFTNVPDLRSALRLLDAVNDDALDLTFDTWHFFRGNPDMDLLRTAQGQRIVEVQLADAARDVRGDLLQDLLHHRRVPGEGDFDISGVVSVLREIGALRSVGPEIFSDEMDQLDAGTAALRARSGLDRFLPSAVESPDLL